MVDQAKRIVAALFPTHTNTPPQYGDSLSELYFCSITIISSLVVVVGVFFFRAAYNIFSSLICLPCTVEHYIVYRAFVQTNKRIFCSSWLLFLFLHSFDLIRGKYALILNKRYTHILTAIVI